MARASDMAQLERLHKECVESKVWSQEFTRSLRNAFPAMLKALREKSELERIGAAAKQIQPMEWEYIFRKLDACTDKSWAISQELRDLFDLMRNVTTGDRDGAGNCVQSDHPD